MLKGRSHQCSRECAQIGAVGVHLPPPGLAHLVLGYLRPDGGRPECGAGCARRRAVAPHLPAPGVADIVADYCVELEGTCRLAVDDVARVARARSTHLSALVALPGNRFATGCLRSPVIRVWDAGTGDLLRILAGHRDSIYALAAMGDGRLVSGSADGYVRVWGLDSGAREPCEHALGKRFSQPVYALAELPGSRLASGGHDRNVYIWGLARAPALAAIVRALEGHTGCINSLAALYDGERLASGSDDMTVRVWNISEGTCYYVLAHHAQVYATIVFNGMLTSGDRLGGIKMWDDATCVRELDAPCCVKSLAVLPEGALVSGGGKSIQVWGSTGALLELGRRDRNGVIALAISTGGRLISGYMDPPGADVWD